MMVLSCEKDNFISEQEHFIVAERDRGPKIKVCHYTGSDPPFVTIEVYEDQLERYLAMGDIIGTCSGDYNCINTDCGLCNYMEYMKKEFVPGSFYCEEESYKEHNGIVEDYWSIKLFSKDGKQQLQMFGRKYIYPNGTFYDTECHYSYLPMGISENVRFASTEEGYRKAYECFNVIRNFAIDQGIEDQCKWDEGVPPDDPTVKDPPFTLDPKPESFYNLMQYREAIK